MAQVMRSAGGAADQARLEAEGLQEGGRRDNGEATPRSQEASCPPPGGRAQGKETAPSEKAAKLQL